MMRQKIYQIDAFTDRPFGGNPAAVCVMDSWLPDPLMQQVAEENNLAETAFVVKREDDYEIRWFTPALEVDLCGHATLASAYVLFNYYGHTDAAIKFYSPRSGKLAVSKEEDGRMTLDFPVDELQEADLSQDLVGAMGKQPHRVLQGKTDFLFVYETQEAIENLRPDMRALAALGGRGIIATAPGKDVDFVSRFFAPQSGIDEDPVTGSAHTTLTPYWNSVTGKTDFNAVQLSARKGHLRCRLKGNRVLISGHAVPYLEGEILLPTDKN